MDYFLKEGYSVRAAVRSASKGAYLKEKYGTEYGEKLEIIAVGDMEKVCPGCTI